MEEANQINKIAELRRRGITNFGLAGRLISNRAEMPLSEGTIDYTPSVGKNGEDSEQKLYNFIAESYNKGYSLVTDYKFKVINAVKKLKELKK